MLPFKKSWWGVMKKLLKKICSEGPLKFFKLKITPFDLLYEFEHFIQFFWMTLLRKILTPTQWHLHLNALSRRMVL